MKYVLLSITLLLSNVALGATKLIEQQAFINNQLSKTAYTLIDVRSPEEFAQGHIKGAINIPHNEISENIVLLNSIKDKTLVVYCRSGRRADIFEQDLAKKGFTLLHLNGDFNAWQENNLPIKKN